MRPPTAPPPGCVEQARLWARRELTESSSPGLDADVLLAHILGKDRAWLLAHGDEGLTLDHTRTYGQLVGRRKLGEPVAYLRGYVSWFGMHLEVSPDVLVPRPETELVVERAIRLAHGRGAQLVADVGTGSGGIAIALATNLPKARIYATDLSPEALVVAGHNVTRHVVADRIVLLHGNLAEPLDEEPDMVVANLPYLSDRMMDCVGRDVRFEPEGALRGGHHGLELYDALMEQLERRSWRPYLVFEIDPRQSDDMSARYAGYSATIECDYAGRERIAVLRPTG